MERKWVKHGKTALFWVLFLVSAILCQQIVVLSIANQQLKHEYAEANHIKYGLFSVNAWKAKLQVIVVDEINSFDFSKANQRQVKEHIQNQLSVLIDKVSERIRESNQDSAKGRFKQAFINAFVDIDEIKKGIPEYADSIMKELSKDQNERKIKGMLKKSVVKYFDKTFENRDLSKVEEIIEDTGAQNIDEAKSMLRSEIIATGTNVNHKTWGLIAAALILFAMAKLSKSRPSPAQFGLLLMTLIALLICGVATPMIDMEAKISELSFVLLDHQVQFLDQVLYFQSKSIMDVFGIMIVHKDVQMKVVGVLMVTFSIIFPALKILSSIVYYNNFRNLRDSKVIQFFVLKSGKWSMADVLVVAIFMAYIGFNGILATQLSKLSEQSEKVMLVTTNGTSLQPGFYLFLTFALLALFVPGLLKRSARPADMPAVPASTVTL